MFSLWTVAGLVAVLLMGAPGWTEENRIESLLTQRRQLHELTGKWEFRIDMSLTFPEYPDAKLEARYNINEVGQYLGGLDEVVALGNDESDMSSFAIRVNPRDIGGQRYSFSMSEDTYHTESRKRFCYHHQFNQVGNYVLGYVKVTKEGGKDYCTDIVGIGFLTGVRIPDEALDNPPASN